MTEQWKEVKGYEGLYSVSSTGLVKSLDRTARIHSGAYRTIRGRVLKQSIDNAGYPYVSLWKDNKGSTIRVHALVADGFIEKSDDSLVVNHMNGDKAFNFRENLEWVTQQENVQHAFDTGLCVGSNTGKLGMYHNNPKSGRIRMPCGDVLIFKSQADLCREFGLNGSGLSRVFRGKQSHYKGWSGLAFGVEK